MIESIHFHNFKVLKATELKLGWFNLIAGPNGSGKTTLLQSLWHLGELARADLGRETEEEEIEPTICESDIRVQWKGGEEVAMVRLPCVEGSHGQHLEISKPEGKRLRGTARRRILQELASVRLLQLETDQLGAPCKVSDPCELTRRGGGFSRLLLGMRDHNGGGWESWKRECLGLLDEFRDIQLRVHEEEVQLWVETREGLMLDASQLSQGTLAIFALLSLPFTPDQPRLLCLEEVERGIHPRMLREVRDALYRIAYPADYNLDHPPVQVVATTQSPYLLDLFQENPDEIIFSAKEKGCGTFTRLSDQPDYEDLLAQSTIGELWYSGVLGGVPYYR